jgi:hypothetical protein
MAAFRFSVVVALALPVTPSLGQGAPDTVEWVLPGCQAIISDQLAVSPLKAGICGGSIKQLLFIANALPREHRMCPPRGVTLEQAVRVVVQYLPPQSPRLQEPFYQIAMEALSSSWPCRGPTG